MNLKEALSKKLTEYELKELKTSYDTVGSIAILEVPKSLVKKEKIIANEILRLHTNIKTVCKKTGIHGGKYRTRELKVIAGEKTKETEYKEHGCIIKLDVEKVYFSSRLSNERKRIYQLIKPKEDVLVMFSGCAPYVCVISKNTKAKNVYGIEINPIAHKYAVETIKLNKLNNVILIKGNVSKVAGKLKKKFDRIVMPLPKSAGTFLKDAFKVSKRGTVIHFYDFQEEGKFVKAKEKVLKECKKYKKKCKILDLAKCGQYAPRKYRVCVDFKII